MRARVGPRRVEKCFWYTETREAEDHPSGLPEVQEPVLGQVSQGEKVMSQSALRPAKKGEEVYVELQDDRGFNIAWGTGMTERQAADQAEQRWRRTFGRGIH